MISSAADMVLEKNIFKQKLLTNELWEFSSKNFMNIFVANQHILSAKGIKNASFLEICGPDPTPIIQPNSFDICILYGFWIFQYYFNQTSYLVNLTF